jgi:hypothetical protein
MKSSRWMKLVALILSLMVMIPALAMAQAGGGSGGGTGGNGGGAVNGRGGNATFRANNPIPVLIYTVWGLGTDTSSGVSSSSDVSTLVIYDNGLATWSQSNADGSNTSGCSGNCLDTVQISASQINQLVTDLRRAGAFRQVSNNGSASSSDTTLTTITIFSHVQGSTSVAQTFSFNDTTGAQGRLPGIQNVFSGFFSSNFGSSNINGGGGGSGSGDGSGGGS